MPDDETPLPGLDDAPDERNERLAALLAVEPLDDVTRRRLVSTAIRSTGSARRARRLIAAAAVVMVLVAGTGVVVAVGGGGDSTSSTAAREPANAATPKSGRAQSSIAATATDVGDFGDLALAANVDRLRRAFDASMPLSERTPAPTGAASAAGQATAGDQAGPDALVNRFRALGCSPSTLPTGIVVALASGTLDGHPVIVVDLESAGGAHSFHAIETDTCTVHRLS